MAAPAEDKLFLYIFTRFDSILPELADHILFPKYGMFYGKSEASTDELIECLSGFGPQLLSLVNKRSEVPTKTAEVNAALESIKTKLAAIGLRPAGRINTKQDYVSAIQTVLLGVFEGGLASTFVGLTEGKPSYTVDKDCARLDRLVRFSSNTTKSAPGTYKIQELVMLCYNYVNNKPISDATLRATVDELTGTTPVGVAAARELELRLAALRSSGLNTGGGTTGGGRRRKTHRRSRRRRTHRAVKHRRSK